GACHSSVGDLLVGRSQQLTASSTCGLFGPEKYCIVGYLEDTKKCFTCDSRQPYQPLSQTNSHFIENVVTRLEHDRKKWWQSENGVDHVSIQLDLENMFQFSHLILIFKRSADYGQTWKVYRYFAQNCTASFPDIPSRPPEEVGDLVCDSKYSDIEPSTEGEVIFKVLDPRFEIENSYSPYIQELVAFTNLRINFTKLHMLGDTLLGEKKQSLLRKYYYALYEMVVHGSCMCNGHASHCGPGENLRGDVFHEPGMVHGNCLCEHNTDGLSCERCKDFYNDIPWRPAEGSQENACRTLLASVVAKPMLKASVVTSASRITMESMEAIRLAVSVRIFLSFSCSSGLVDLSQGVTQREVCLSLFATQNQESVCARNLSLDNDVQPTTMPRCDVYFQQQGYDFKIENGTINPVPFSRNPALNIVIKEVVPGKPVTWSGLGFVRVQSKAGLRFLINNVPFLMDFNVIVRYEPEASADWRATIIVKSSGPAGSEHCKNRVALEEPRFLDLPSTRRSDPEPKSQSSILVDSIEEFQRYHCVESASEIRPHILPETCTKLIASLSARIHNGAIPCRCHLQGSLNSHCTKLGGQCQCKPNVVGRCCDKCAAGSHSFGPQGCLGDRTVFLSTGSSRPAMPSMPSRIFWLSPLSSLCLQRLRGTLRSADWSVTAVISAPVDSTEIQVHQQINVFLVFAITTRMWQTQSRATRTLESVQNAYTTLMDQTASSTTGECPCSPHVIGEKCDRCAPGFWNMAQRRGCCPCGCHPKRSINNICQCPCNAECKCNKEGTLIPVCDQDTGVCHCRTGFTGKHCDQCARNHNRECPSCPRCHICFDQWDNIMNSLSWRIQKLLKFAAMLAEKRKTMPGCDFNFKGHESKIADLEKVLKSSIIENLQKDIDNLSESLQKTMEVHHRMNYLQFQDHGGAIRSNASALLNDLGIKENVTLSHLKMFTMSEIDNINGKVCGMPGNFSCAVAECGGALCRDRQGNKHCGGPNCDGAYPLSTNAFRKADLTGLLLSNLTNQTQGSQNKIKNIRKMTEDTKEKTLELHGKLEKSKYQIENERENMKELIKRLKNFLLEKVANYVLAINMHEGPQELPDLLNNLKSLITHCEDSTKYTKGLKKQQEEDKTKALTVADEIVSHLKEVELTQRQTQDALTTFNEKMEETITTKGGSAEAAGGSSYSH
ncbi:hypothetical protein E2320_005838, partial [Naja naja]